MKKIIVGIFISLTLLSFKQAPKNQFLGFWEFESDEETEAKSGIIFTDSTFLMYISWGGGLDPQPLGKKHKYIISKEKIYLLDSTRTDTMSYKFMPNNRLFLISEKDTIKLMKLKK